MCGILLLSITGHPVRNFSTIRNEYIHNITSFQLPELQLDFKKNLPLHVSITSIDEQQKYFKILLEELKLENRNALTEKDLLDLELMEYEARLGLQRLDCEADLVRNHPDISRVKQVTDLPEYKKWYQYFLNKWLCDEVNPDSIFAFGNSQVKRAQDNIKMVIKKSGLNESNFYKHLKDTAFFTNDKNEINERYEKIQTTISSNLQKLFFDYSIPKVKITKSSNKELAQTPGYYSNGTFFYNYFDQPYNKRCFDWLYIHEAVPGHHFQSSIAERADRSEVQRLFWYPGYAEGWGAYVEEYGKDLGVYINIYDELGRWEWDLVRSVRVPMDIGLNYYGWSDEKALAFWKLNIKNQDEIALREIARVKRWPVQAITYKYGSDQFIRWREKIKSNEGNHFDIRKFHDAILKRGGLPFAVLKKMVFKNVK